MTSYKSLLVGLFIVFSTCPVFADDPPFEDLAQYYAKNFFGLIQPTPQHEFALDIVGFEKTFRGEDFLTAKRNYYSSLLFDTKSQTHARPFYYMEKWKSLFHPPIHNPGLARMAPGESLNAELWNPEFQKQLDTMSDTELTYQNQLQLLPNSSAFKEKLRLVHDAKKFIWMTVMAYFCESSTEEMMDRLVEKQREGVDVRIVVEGLYASTLNKKCVKRMRDLGLEVVVAHDFLHLKTFSAVMHNKFWIRDGEEAILGGQNMQDFTNLSDGFSGMSRDTDVHVVGPAVTDLMAAYTDLWNTQKKPTNLPLLPNQNTIADRKAQERQAGLRGLNSYEQPMNGVCRVLVQNAGAKSHAIAPVIGEYFKRANGQIIFSSPSLEFKGRAKELRDILIDTASRGVKIDVISNGIDGATGFLDDQLQKIEAQLTIEQKPFLRRLLRGLHIFADKKSGLC